MKTYIVAITLLLLVSFCHAQQNKIDSLFTIYNNKTLPDTIRLKAIDDITWSYIDNNNPDTAFIFGQQELQLATDKKQKKWQSNALNIIGHSFENKNDYTKALDYYLRCLKINEELSDKKRIAKALRNIGDIYRELGNYSKALDYNLSSLKIRKEIGNKKGIASSLMDVGNIYNLLTDYSEALDCYFKALKIREELKDKSATAIALNNIGDTYCKLSNYPKSLDYLMQSLRVSEELNSKSDIAYASGSIGELYLKQKQYEKALQYTTKAMQLCVEMGDIAGEKETQNKLYIEYKAIGNSKQALTHYERFILLKDSINLEEKQKQLIHYEFEKKEIASKAEQDKLDAINAEEKKKQQIVIYAVAGLLVLVAVFALFMFNRFRITQKQKAVIEEQKILVDKAYASLHEKNKEVMDSIRYAKRIQIALIPSERYIQAILDRLKKT